jgi:plasmid stabilization system protein ParE
MLVRKLLGATDQLESFPASGRMVSEIEDESLREVIYRNDRIIYIHMRGEDKVEGLSVVHAS